MDQNARRQARIIRDRAHVEHQLRVLRHIWWAARDAGADTHTMTALERWLAARAEPLRFRPVSDWIDMPEAQAWARRMLDELVPMIDESAVTISIVPKGPSDIKFAVELGLSVMLDKPIVALVFPGTRVPAKLARVVDEIVEWSGSAQDPWASERIMAAVNRLRGDAT